MLASPVRWQIHVRPQAADRISRAIDLGVRQPAIRDGRMTHTAPDWVACGIATARAGTWAIEKCRRCCRSMNNDRGWPVCSIALYRCFLIPSMDPAEEVALSYYCFPQHCWALFICSSSNRGRWSNSFLESSAVFSLVFLGRGARPLVCLLSLYFRKISHRHKVSVTNCTKGIP